MIFVITPDSKENKVLYLLLITYSHLLTDLLQELLGHLKQGKKEMNAMSRQAQEQADTSFPVR